MNLNLIKKSDDVIDRDEVLSISGKLKLPPKFVELMHTRGIIGEEAVKRFLYPSESNFHDPLTMKGMPEAVARINEAIAAKERIVVYGDYDADGICSAAILSLYLAERGLEVYTHIPSRINDGYGLSIESIEKIIEDCTPDLILTCDCGISGYKEVEAAKDLGVEVIVTDHHEVSDIIPDCIVVNPHQTDCNYPFKYLCGAGVALKLVEALGGLSAAKKFWELAAVATIADLVPLVDENRLIVQLGLNNVDNIRNIGLKKLLLSQKITDFITSSDIAFKIAPRINAAGRMGDAYSAFELLTTDDLAKVAAIIEDINVNNSKRKDYCIKLYNEAMADLDHEDLVNKRCIVLSHPEWEKGITGIVAARLAGEYNRPSFILVKQGAAYKGTARSIPNINIYNLLTNAADLLVEYGGHSQAAGFSILPENIEAFKERVNNYLSDFPREYFEPSLVYDIDIDESEINTKLVKCLDLLEPTGNSNTKPIFKLTVKSLKLQPCKTNVQHTQITLPNLNIFAFNNYNKNHFLMTEGEKSVAVELQNNVFGGKEYIRGILKGVAIEKLTFSDEVAQAGFIKMASIYEPEQPEFTEYEDINSIIGDNMYGTLVICGCKSSYEKFVSECKCDNIILHEFMFASQKNNYSRIIVSPEFDDNLRLTGYDKMIFLDRPISPNVVTYINKRSRATVYLPPAADRGIMQAVSLDRAVFAQYYDAFKRFKDVKSPTLWGYYKLLTAHIKLDLRQFITCLSVFVDLGFISVPKEGDFCLNFNPDVRADLASSALYKYFAEYKG